MQHHHMLACIGWAWEYWHPGACVTTESHGLLRISSAPPYMMHGLGMGILIHASHAPLSGTTGNACMVVEDLSGSAAGDDGI